MRVIHMIDDYEILCNEKKEIGGYEAYKNYTLKYEDVFDSIVKNIYRLELDDLKMLVNAINFTSNYDYAKEYYYNGIVDSIINEVETIASLLNFKEDFDLYIGLELGKVEEFSARDSNGRAFIYIGLDRNIDKNYIEEAMKDEIENIFKLHLK